MGWIQPSPNDGIIRGGCVGEQKYCFKLSLSQKIIAFLLSYAVA